MRTGAVVAVVLALLAAADVSTADILQMRDGGAGPEPAAAQPSHSYYVIPVSGEIGRDVTRDVVAEALRQARLRKPDVVVLDINSPGGHVLELEAIIALLAENSDLRLVAYVRNAPAEAAALAVTCGEVYAGRSSRIGGELSFAAGKDGIPKEAEKVFRGVWRACCLKAVEIGRHSPLIAEGMTDPDVELFVANVGGKPALSSKAPVEGAVPFKRRGRLLALTSKQAVECGLAVAEIGDYIQLGRELALPGWQKQGSAEGILGRQKAELLKTERALMKEAGLRRLKIARWSQYLAMKPQLDGMRDVLHKLWAEGREQEKRRRELQDQYAYEINRINHAYNVQAAAASRAKDPQREESVRRELGEKTSELNYAYELELAPVKKELTRLAALYVEKMRERKERIRSLELP